MQSNKQLTAPEKHPDEFEESGNVELEEMVTDKDIKEVLGIFEQVPPFLLKIAVSGNMNVVKKNLKLK